MGLCWLGCRFTVETCTPMGGEKWPEPSLWCRFKVDACTLLESGEYPWVFPNKDVTPAHPCGWERTLWNYYGNVVITCEDVCGLFDWTAALWTIPWTMHFPRPPWSNLCGDFAMAHSTLVFALLHSAMLIKLVYTVNITGDRNSTSRQRQTHTDEDNMVQIQEQIGRNWWELEDG